MLDSRINDLSHIYDGFSKILFRKFIEGILKYIKI